MHTVPLDRDHFVWLLASLCHIERIAFDAHTITQQHPPPHTLAQFIEAARALGFSITESSSQIDDWRRLPVPAIAFATRAEDDASGSSEGHPLLIVKSDGKRVLYFVPHADESRTTSTDDIAQRLAPTILLARYEHPAMHPAEDAGARREFGFVWIARELARHRRIWRDVAMASLVLQVIGLATPVFTQVVIDKVVVHQSRSTLIAIVLGLAMFMVFGAVLTWVRQYLILHTGNRVDAVLGSAVFRHLFAVPLPYFEQRSTGTLVARLQCVETVREFVTGAAITLMLDLPFLFVFVAVMFAYSWQLTLIALGVMTMVAALTFAVGPVLRARLNQQFLLGARNQAFVTEYITGMETVKSLQLEPRVTSRYDDLLAKYLAAGFSARQVSNSYSVVANLIEQLMTVAILSCGALLVMRNDGFTIGMLVAFQMFSGRLSQPMLRLAGLWQEFQQANIAVRRLGDIMNAPAEVHSMGAARGTTDLAEVDVRDVAFRYSADRPHVFRRVSFTLKPGHLTVLTGPSGCGKSTLGKLMLGFYCPTEGQIVIDGRDITQIPVNQLRAEFGVVPQETYLFSGSILENLLVANPDARLEDAIRACRLAEVHEVIEKLPKGYGTHIGEHGVGLSGGQKQRLAIARALLKGPRVLIFDEATSHLDAQTAEQFARTVSQLRGKVTILFIAHEKPKGLVVDETVVLRDLRGAVPASDREERTNQFSEQKGRTWTP